MWSHLPVTKSLYNMTNEGPKGKEEVLQLVLPVALRSEVLGQRAHHRIGEAEVLLARNIL